MAATSVGFENVPVPTTPFSAPGVGGVGWTTGPATPFGATWMWAATMLPGRLLATSFHSTVPVASLTTWATNSPLAALVAAAQPGTSSSLLSTATKVVAGGWAPRATAAVTSPAAARTRTLESLFIG